MHTVLCYFITRTVISTSLLVVGISTGLWLVTVAAAFGLLFNGTGVGAVMYSWCTRPPRLGTAVHVVPRKMR